MDAEKMIRELRVVQKKHKEDKLDTFEITISAMAKDSADMIESLVAERDAAVTELSALKESVRWIPTSERLPEIESTEVWEMYLCKLNRYGEIKIAPLWFIGGNWYSGSAYYDDFVVAWRPLPEAPESEEK